MKRIFIILISVLFLTGCSICDHLYVSVIKTYSEPSIVDLSKMRGTSSNPSDYYITVQRVALGTTTILYKCRYCNSQYKQVLLGRQDIK